MSSIVLGILYLFKPQFLCKVGIISPYSSTITRIQRGGVTCPNSWSYDMVDGVSDPATPDCGTSALNHSLLWPVRLTGESVT